MMNPFYLFSFLNLFCLLSFTQYAELVQRTTEPSGKTVGITTRLENPLAQPIHFKRVIQKGEMHYFLQLYLEESSLPFYKGAMVVFTDGAKIQWTDARVESTRKGAHYSGQCEILLTEDLVDQFQEKRVARIQLSSCERVLTPTQAQQIPYLINCVLYADFFGIN